MKKALTALLQIFFLITFFSAMSVSADDWPSYCQGAPLNYIPGKTPGYFLWYDKEWNIRTSTTGARHIFEGVVSSDKDIKITNRINLEMDEGDYVTRIGPNQIIFRLTTESDEDGFVFKTDGSTLVFDLKRDGGQAEIKYIYFGRKNSNPAYNPIIFTKQ